MESTITTAATEEVTVSSAQSPKKYYDETGQEVLFPGGPTVAQRDYWKQLYTSIYATDFMDEVVIWRGMNRAEYKKVFSENAGSDELLFEEILASKVILYEESWYTWYYSQTTS